MTHYLVRHGSNDYRLHAADGSEAVTTTWSERPDLTDLATAIADDGPGGSLLGQSDLRAAFVDVVSGGVVYRDLTIEGEIEPWK